MDAAIRHHAVAVLQIMQHFLLLLLPALIGQEQEEIEDQKNGNQRQQADQWRSAGICLQEDYCQEQSVRFSP